MNIHELKKFNKNTSKKSIEEKVYIAFNILSGKIYIMNSLGTRKSRVLFLLLKKEVFMENLLKQELIKNAVAKLDEPWKNLTVKDVAKDLKMG